MNYLKYGIGMDIGMDYFDGCISIIDTLQQVSVKASKRFANTKKASLSSTTGSTGTVLSRCS